jgi:hypothetical protein
MNTTLAQDIHALVEIGHNLERATELAVADRNRNIGNGSKVCVEF